MTTQPFLRPQFRNGPPLSKEQTSLCRRKVKYITDLVGLEVHAVYLVGELPYQP
jgi:hypothetical protein